MKTTKNNYFLKFSVIIVLLVVTGLYALKTGSLSVTWSELISGLFIEYNSTVAIIYDLRIPRILVAIISGGALALSGLLFQCILKNPMADPALIGISGGASLVSSIIMALFPSLLFLTPLFSSVGGILAYVLIYTLAWKGSLEPIRIILIGVAMSAFFLGLESVFGSMGNSTGVSLSVSGLTQLVWSDVNILLVYVVIFIIISLFLAPICNIMMLEDGAIRGLGVDVDKARILISLIAVILCSVVTSVIGVVSFLALIVPHMSKKIIGNDYKFLIPYTIILGAFILLLADTLGRTIMPPMEISASVLMNIIGGPCFIVLLRKELNYK